MLKRIILILLFVSVSYSQSFYKKLIWDYAETYKNSETTIYIQGQTISQSQANRIDNFISMIKDSLGIGSLSEFWDVLYLTGNETQTLAYRNLVSRNYDLTLGSATVTFTQWQGFNSDGIGGYLNTNYNPSTNGVNFTQNSCNITIYSISNIAEAKVDFANNNGLYCRLRSDNGYLYNRLNDASNQLISTTDSRGCFTLVRASSDTLIVYRNGTVFGTKVQVSSAINNSNIHLLGSPYNSTYGTKKIIFFGVGKEPTSVQARKIKNCLEYYADDIGVGVIP